MVYFFFLRNAYLKKNVYVFSLLDSKSLDAKEQENCREEKTCYIYSARQAVHLAVGLDVQGLTRADKPTSNFHDYLKGLLLSKRKY